jgi:HPt (histidine-containing phosphotransfer) domain-containing protein
MSGQAMAPFRPLATPRSPSVTAGDRPIDLVHLSRQTLGDRDLEIELLSLFERQSAQAVQRLRSHTACADPKWRRDLAHTLKGSARAIGATRVACAAQHYEDLLCASPNEAILARSLVNLTEAIEEACAAARNFISEA